MNRNRRNSGKQAHFLQWEDPMIFAEMMGQQLMHCHVNDFDPEHSCLLPGFGDFDIRELYRRLNMSGYQGDLITEV